MIWNISDYILIIPLIDIKELLHTTEALDNALIRRVYTQINSSNVRQYLWQELI